MTNNEREHNMTEKRCGKCRLVKAETEFAKDVTRGDGLQNWCRDCRAAHYARPEITARAVDYRTEHRERLNLYQRTYYHANKTRKGAR